MLLQYSSIIGLKYVLCGGGELGGTVVHFAIGKCGYNMVATYPCAK